MAEMKRALAGARTRENGPISLSAKCVLYHLHTYCDKDEFIAYWAGKRARPRVMLHKKLEGVAIELDISVKQLRRHMQLLADELLIGWHGGDWFEIISIPERDRLLGKMPRLDPEARTPVNPGHEGSLDINVPPPRDTYVPDQGHMCPKTGTHMSKNRDTYVPPSLVGSDRDQDGIGSGSRARARATDVRAGASGAPNYQEIAREIILLAPQPPGLPALPATEVCVRDLAGMLAAGWPREQVVEVLGAAPPILAAAPSKAGFYGPLMFSRPDVWWRWCQDAEAHKAKTTAPRLVPPVESVTTDHEAAELAQREAEERELHRRVLAAIENPPVPTEWDRAGWRAVPRWKAALMFAPAEAQRSARAVMAEARAERREATLIELTRALNAVEFDPTGSEPAPEVQSGPDVLNELRALRARAEAEGRRPTLEELQALGQEGQAP